MPRIKMIETDRGCPDGFTVTTYEKGEEYTVNASLAKAFCDDRQTANRVEGKKRKGKSAGKAKKAAPENKVIAAADENKAKR